MSRIFIAHAWSDDENYSQRQLDFIRKLELELEEKNLEVIYDDNIVNKNTLNQFMIENIRNCDVILPICDKAYLEKSEKDSGVSFEIKEITEHNFLDKVIPIKISADELPYNFGTLPYESFCKEFEEMSFDSSEQLNSLFRRLSEKLSKEELWPQDKLKEEVHSQLDSIGLISNVLNSTLKLSDLYTYPELRIDGKENISYLSAEKLLNSKYYLDKFFIVGDR